MDDLEKAHIIFSRAYYAMFHAAEAVLMAHHGLSFRKHSAVVSQFGLHFARTGLVPQEMHLGLVQAFEVRNHADYDMLVTVTEEEASYCCRAAEEFLHCLQALL